MLHFVFLFSEWWSWRSFLDCRMDTICYSSLWCMKWVFLFDVSMYSFGTKRENKLRWMADEALLLAWWTWGFVVGIEINFIRILLTHKVFVLRFAVDFCRFLDVLSISFSIFVCQTKELILSFGCQLLCWRLSAMLLARPTTKYQENVRTSIWTEASMIYRVRAATNSRGLSLAAAAGLNDSQRATTVSGGDRFRSRAQAQHSCVCWLISASRYVRAEVVSHLLLAYLLAVLVLWIIDTERYTCPRIVRYAPEDFPVKNLHLFDVTAVWWWLTVWQQVCVCALWRMQSEIGLRKLIFNGNCEVEWLVGNGVRKVWLISG